MTVDTPTAALTEPAPQVDEAALPDPGAAVPEGEAAAVPAVEQPLAINLVALSALLAVGAVAWMFAGVFDGSFPRVVGLLAAGVGVGTVALSYRTERPALLQYLVPAVGAALGAALTLASASAGQGSLPTLVTSAIRNGGISHPPIPFDPGWRFFLVELIVSLGGAATTMAVSLRKPKLAILVPAPLVFLGALAQPPKATLVSSIGALVLFIGSFGAAYGVDLARDGANSRGFEFRRAARAVGVLLGLVAALVALSASGLLLPKATDHAVIPPQFPQTPPPPPAGVLFTVDLPQPLPLRLGVLDVYRTDSWLTPPFDPARFQTLKGGEQVETGRDKGDSRRPDASPDDPHNLRITFTAKNLGGHLLPSVASPIAAPHQGFTLQYDPRTQSLRVPDKLVPSGLTYTEVAGAIATGKQLEQSPPAPASLAEYLAAPSPPPVVQALLAKAPKTNLYDRLQYVRTVFYQRVVAKGSGDPVPVAPSRVAELLAGKPGTPFEIVAAEALLSRWAGVPARIGYGYYSKTPDKAGSKTYSITALDGAVWLESYFDHHGWVPIVGTPPKAQSSLDNKPKKQSPTIRPSQRLDLVVYVPFRQDTYLQLFTVVRYWLLRLLPLVIGLVGLAIFYPGLLKAVRRWRRYRWTARYGPREAVAVAYSELRDGATDLNIGHPAQTALEFLEEIDDDPEHVELAWLVTRVLWGDLRRDARVGDAELAADMAASVLRRVRQANPALNRIAALASRASLRDPYSEEIPNLWLQWSPRRRIAHAVRRMARALRSRRPRRLRLGVLQATILLAALVSLSGCSQGAAASPSARSLPDRLVPASLGGLTFVQERAAEAQFARQGKRSLVAEGRVFSVHQGPVIVGDVQVALFRSEYSSRLARVKRDVLNGIAGRNFRLTRVGTQQIYLAQLPGELLMMWFSPDGSYYVLVDAQSSFAGAQDLFLSLLSYQQGGAAVADSGIAPVDPRRGADYPMETQP